MSTTGADSTVGSDETGAPGGCRCERASPDQRCIRFVNTCDYPIDAGLTGEDVGGPLDLEVALLPSECSAVALTELVGGRAFARVGCTDEGCESDGNDGRGTLVQATLTTGTDDVYDVSLVGGFNVPMALVPVGIDRSPKTSDCRSARCAANLNAVCPDALARAGSDGLIAYCTTPCLACDDCPACIDCADTADPTCAPCAGLAELCCTGQSCEPNEHTMLWKELCPDAITDPRDDTAFTCSGDPDYDVVFCP